MKRILTIQDISCLGKCSLTVALPVISAMGAGNKLDPTKLQVADIYSTKVCPLARVMRYELRKRGVKRLKVVYSEELPVIPRSPEVNGGKPVPGSVMFVPAAAGLILAGEVVRGLVKNAE